MGAATCQAAAVLATDLRPQRALLGGWPEALDGSSAGAKAIDDATLLSRPMKNSKIRVPESRGTDTRRNQARADAKMARLKKAIDRGYEDAAAGRVIVLDGDAEIDRFFKRL